MSPQPRRSGLCPTCGRRTMLRNNGRIGGHGPEDDRCPGVGGPPEPNTVRQDSDG